jgi:hypothetical protein
MKIKYRVAETIKDKGSTGLHMLLKKIPLQEKNELFDLLPLKKHD